jgi:hypothetical protein
MKKAITKIFYSFVVINIIWLAMSYCEIFIKQTWINPDYSPFNYFALLFKLFGLEV